MKKAIVSILAAALIVSVSFFVYEAFFEGPHSVDTISKIPGLTLWDINYVKNVKGVPVWSLEVDSAVKNEKTGTLVGSGIRLTLFKEGKAELVLDADKGEADVKRGVFKVWGDVVITLMGDNCTLETDRIVYEEKSQMLFSDTEARFRCRGLVLTGAGLSVDIGSRSVEMARSVQALLE